MSNGSELSLTPKEIPLQKPWIFAFSSIGQVRAGCNYSYEQSAEPVYCKFLFKFYPESISHRMAGKQPRQKEQFSQNPSNMHTPMQQHEYAA